MKNTPIHENITAQFRMDAFNFFNYISPGNPGNTCIDCTGAGIITGMAIGQSPRQLEFSVTLVFELPVQDSRDRRSANSC